MILANSHTGVALAHAIAYMHKIYEARLFSLEYFSLFSCTFWMFWAY